jgi:hypothetical protein
MPVPLLAACSLVAPALAAARAEKAVLRMIAAESAIFVKLDIVLSPSFVRRRRCDGTPDKIDKRSRYSRSREGWCVTSYNFFVTS